MCSILWQRLLLAMITISIAIHFTTLYMDDLGTREKSLGEGAHAEKGKGKERRELKPLRRREPSSQNFDGATGLDYQ